MFKSCFSLFLAFCLAFLLCGSLSAAKRNTMTCDWCGKKIASDASFLKSEDKNFCSEKCFNQYVESLLPVCDVCGKRFKSGFTSEGKNFCSKACLETTFRECVHCHRREPKGYLVGDDIFLCEYCRELPACASCMMPLDKFAKDLGDGRSLCRDCAREGIFTAPEMKSLMTSLRQELADMFKMSTDHEIVYELCNRTELKKESTGDGEHELGLFIFNRHTLTFFNYTIRNKDEFRILVLNGQPPDIFRGVAAHEFAHDWMQENLPHIDDPQIREGFAEFVSWAYAKAEKFDRVTWRIEQNTDTVYGDGFRKVRDMMGDARTASEWKKILLKAFPVPSASGK